jgi:RES domain-containing protein
VSGFQGMKLWRLTRAPFVALDGAGALAKGGRYSSPGKPVVPFASEPGLAVLVALRYFPRDLAGIADDYVLGWTEIAATPERVPDAGSEADIRQWVDSWLDSRRSALVAVRSKVLPEANVVLFNPRHPIAETVLPLTTRPFDFAECLHRPPMLDRFSAQS